MSFFTNLRADRLITQIKSTNDVLGRRNPEGRGQAQGAGRRGRSSRCWPALPDADKHATVALVDVLATLANDKTFPQFVEALVRAARASSPASPGR